MDQALRSRVKGTNRLPGDQLVEVIGARDDQTAHGTADGEADDEPLPSPEIRCLTDGRTQRSGDDGDGLG